MFNINETEERVLKLDGVEVRLFPNWIKDAQAKMSEAEKLSLSDEIVTMYSRPSVIERRTVDYGAEYRYNKTAKASIEWERLPLELKEELDLAFGVNFAQCACNEYASSSAYIGPHHDKFTLIGGENREPLLITSISLGAQRTMLLTPPDANLKGVGVTVAALSKVRGSVAIDLPSGSMVLFTNEFNNSWKHSIPKTYKGAGKRISLTYRYF